MACTSNYKCRAAMSDKVSGKTLKLSMEVSKNFGNFQFFYIWVFVLINKPILVTSYNEKVKQ